MGFGPGFVPYWLCGFACMVCPKSVLLHLENGVMIVASIDVSRRIQRGKKLERVGPHCTHHNDGKCSLISTTAVSF